MSVENWDDSKSESHAVKKSGLFILCLFELFTSIDDCNSDNHKQVVTALSFLQCADTPRVGGGGTEEETIEGEL